MNFLPQDYTAPKSNSKYLKFEEGETKLRILTHPVLGWEDWDNKKPIRYSYYKKPDVSIDPSKPVRHFWTFIVWNYRTNRIEIWHLTQSGIRNRIEALSKDSDWGEPFGYDIKITKSGSGKETEYEVNPCPAKEVSSTIKEAFDNTLIDLSEILKGGDPFAATPLYRTKGFWEKGVSVTEDKSSPVKKELSKEQVDMIETDIEMFIAMKEPKWRENLLKTFKVSSFAEVESKYYEPILQRIEAKKQSLTDDEVPF